MTQSNTNIQITLNDDDTKAVYDSLKEWSEKIYGPPASSSHPWDDFTFDLDELMNESKRINREETIDKLLEDDIQSDEDDKE